MIVNLTPHDIHINGNTIQKSGEIARCEERWVMVVNSNIDGFPIAEDFEYHSPILPEPQEGVFYVVSLPVAQAAANRRDLLIAVGQTRDEQGRINGCTALARI